MPASGDHEQQLAKITAFIHQQLDEGKDPKAVLDVLVTRGAPRAEAIKLITQALHNRKPQADAVPPREAPTPAQQPAAGQKEIREFVEAELAAGRSTQQIVDRLLARGMPRDPAMDLVLEIKQANRALATSLQPVMSRPSSGPKLVDNKKWQPYIEQQLLEKKERNEIVEALVREGVPRSDAIDLVLNHTPEPVVVAGSATKSRGVKRAPKSGNNKMLIGGVLAAGGCAITAGSYAVAGVGDTYFIWYGPIVIGVIYFIQGLIQTLRGE